MEELRRRKSRRGEKRRALVAELAPEAPVALDALLEGRSEYRRRLHDFQRAALFEFNRRHGTRHRNGYEVLVDGRSIVPLSIRCRFCLAHLGTVAGGVISLPARGHLAQCALEFLAGLHDTPPKP